MIIIYLKSENQEQKALKTKLQTTLDETQNALLISRKECRELTAQLNALKEDALSKIQTERQLLNESKFASETIDKVLYVCMYVCRESYVDK